MYITKEDVKKATGIKPDDLGLETENDLNDLIDKWITQATNLINEDRNRDYAKEVTAGKRDEVPPGIENICERLVANIIARAILRRETPIVKNDDFEVSMTSDEVFTGSIKSDLARYPMKPSLGFFRVGGSNED